MTEDSRTFQRDVSLPLADSLAASRSEKRGGVRLPQVARVCVATLAGFVPLAAVAILTPRINAVAVLHLAIVCGPFALAASLLVLFACRLIPALRRGGYDSIADVVPPLATAVATTASVLVALMFSDALALSETGGVLLMVLIVVVQTSAVTAVALAGREAKSRS